MSVHRVIPVLITALASIVLAIGATHASAQAAASVSAPATASPGQSIVIIGSGWVADPTGLDVESTYIELYIGDEVATILPEFDGTFTISVAAPDSGTLVVAAYQPLFGYGAETVVEIVVPAPTTAAPTTAAPTTTAASVATTAPPTTTAAPTTTAPTVTAPATTVPQTTAPAAASTNTAAPDTIDGDDTEPESTSLPVLLGSGLGVLVLAALATWFGTRWYSPGTKTKGCIHRRFVVEPDGGKVTGHSDDFYDRLDPAAAEKATDIVKKMAKELQSLGLSETFDDARKKLSGDDKNTQKTFDELFPRSKSTKELTKESVKATCDRLYKLRTELKALEVDRVRRATRTPQLGGQARAKITLDRVEKSDVGSGAPQVELEIADIITSRINGGGPRFARKVVVRTKTHSVVVDQWGGESYVPVSQPGGGVAMGLQRTAKVQIPVPADGVFVIEFDLNPNYGELRFNGQYSCKHGRSITTGAKTIASTGCSEEFAAKWAHDLHTADRAAWKTFELVAGLVVDALGVINALCDVVAEASLIELPWQLIENMVTVLQQFVSAGIRVTVSEVEKANDANLKRNLRTAELFPERGNGALETIDQVPAKPVPAPSTKPLVTTGSG